MEIINTVPWLSVHVTAVLSTLAVVVIADLHGLWWLLGKTNVLPKQRLVLLHNLIWVGLAITITAGAIMFSWAPEYYLSLTAFRLKMLFVLFLLVNAIVIGKHMHWAFSGPFGALNKGQKQALILSGFISTAGWIGAYVCAQFLS